LGGLWALEWAWQIYVCINRWVLTRLLNFSYNFLSSIKIVGATGLGGLSALEWAWHIAETDLRCAGISGICMPYPSIVVFIVSEISAFIRTDGHG